MENVDDDSSAASHIANNDNRNKTLELLRNYIQWQRTLLERTQSDIDKLKTLKQSAADDPRRTLSTILDRDFNNTSLQDEDVEMEPENVTRDSVWVFGRLSQLVEDMQGGNEKTILKTIDWDLFKGHDPTPFLQMSASSRETHPKTVFLPAASMPPPPLPGQVKGAIAPCSSLYPRPRDSYLRNFVREKRAQLVEPVLARATAFLATFGPDSDSENEAEQPGIGKYKRSKAHGNKADVVRRRRQEEAAMIRPRGPGGVFIKRDKAQANGATPSAPSRSRQKRSTPHSPDLNNGTASFPVPPQRRRRTSSVSSVHSFMEIDESAGCKPKRTRRPSSRFMNGSSNAISRSQTTSGKSADFAVPGDMPAPTPKVKLTIRLPPRSSLTVRKPELSPATSPSSTNSLRYRTASTSTSASTSRHSFSPPAFSFSPKIDGGDGEDEMQDYEYSSGAEVDDESRIGYDDDAMSVSTIAATSHSRSRTRSVTPRHFDFSGYSGFGGKTVSTPSTSGHKGANGKGKEKARTRGRTKPKPETFNLPWSVSEQHLLEKLLVDYPDGSHNRWSKISNAMKGRRTPRQVASRVQKYFLKLKKFGVDVVGK